MEEKLKNHTKEDLIDIVHKAKCKKLKGVKLENMTKKDVVDHLVKVKCPEVKKILDKENKLDIQTLIEEAGDKYVRGEPSKKQMANKLKADYPNANPDDMKKVIEHMDAWRLREIHDNKIFVKLRPLKEERDKLENMLVDDMKPAEEKKIQKKLDKIKEKIAKEAKKGHFISRSGELL